MKIPKRTIGYIAITAVLILVLIIQETGDTTQNTIDIGPIPDSPDKILLEQGGQSLPLTKDGKWTVGPEDYPADSERISNLVEVLEGLESAEVVSRRGAYEEYGLDKAQVRRIEVFKDGATVMEIHLGSKSAGGAAVYGRVNGDRAIVLLPFKLDNLFSADPSNFRDKTMANISTANIDKITITSQDHGPVELTRTSKKSQTVAAEEEKEESDGAASSGWRVVSAGEEQDIENSTVDALLQQLSPLLAQGFPEKAPQMDPFANLKIEEKDGTEMVVSLWPPRDDDMYPARVSTSQYGFLVRKWQAKRLLLNMDKYFAGFEAAENDG